MNPTNQRLPYFRFLAALLLVLFAAFLPSCGASSQGVQILPALKQAGLAGKMIFIVYKQNGNQLVRLDLASGQVKTLFAAPNHSWLASAELSPDGRQLLLAYAPPPPNGQVQLANTDLYQMLADGSSAPQPLMTRKATNESFTNPTWAPDGQTIYYTHTVPSNSAPSGVESRIERGKPGGQQQIIAGNAIWPRLSPDGTRLSYLVLAQFTTDNTLSLANADGTSPTALLQDQQFPIVDDHLFSPDGKTMYFSVPDSGLLGDSAPDNATGNNERTVGAGSPRPGMASTGTEGPGLPAPTAFPWWQWPFGVQTVSAHNNPSDWFAIDISGGQPQSKPRMVARVKEVNMIAAFSPDGAWLAFVSQKGLFVMRPDGSQLTQLGNFQGMGSLNWKTD